MKVIGAGLPRTATLTQKVALEMLGVGPCYHMVNVLSDLSLVRPWREALDGQADWDRLFDGFQATVDWPGGFFYRELAEAYPDAKVLLSVRDPQAWERSMRATVWGVNFGRLLIADLSAAAAKVDPAWCDYLALMSELLWTGNGTLAGDHHEAATLIEAYERHNERVTEYVPADRLLVWRTEDGWEPLCEFLDVEVPNVPMPRLNDTEMFANRVIDMSLGTLNAWWDQARPAALGPPPPVAAPARA